MISSARAGTPYRTQACIAFGFGRTRAKMRGWKQAPSSEDDGVAVILEAAMTKMAAVKA